MWRTVAVSPAIRDAAASARAASRQLSIARLQLDEARLAARLGKASQPWRPVIGARVQLEMTGNGFSSQSDWRDAWNTNIVLSLGTRTTLYDGGRSAARRLVADVDVRRAAAGITAVEQQVRLRVQEAVASVVTAQATIEDGNRQREAAEEQFRTAQVSFDTELITRLELGGAQLGLLQARLQELTASYALEVALFALEQILGD